ncbi:carbohydrate porin [Nostoc sp. FACHB-87]|uniref:iron uptake porin n=1 Tax=Nostocaceae TaxID=1162 RepID=UPI0016821A3D|nr:MULTISPECIES: iron uptake porin [Nostocaceae]MBD2452780.1 carbohydrate porin [Nostoc sp. FACHB-87]MBD2473711.1 carbohydrate porin [Anabaena sp. FACHB-83]
MAKYLLASASGASFLCLINGLLPIQALANSVPIDNNSLVNVPQKSAIINSQVAATETKLILADGSQPQAPAIKSEAEIQDSSASHELQTSDNNDNPQVTSVSQLSDVQPTDWAFQALQSLVERYGCIAGYPNGSYRGNRAMTRYEFAAGLNACLERVNELIATATSDLVKKEDLATLQKLQEDFAAELATLRGRVDALEGRTAELEANQFSTTTKLNGEVIIAGIGATGGAPNQGDPNIILVNRVRLNLSTSFTGKDLLITGLQAYNFLGGVDGSGSLQNSLGLASDLLVSSSARTSFEPLFPGFDVKTLSPQSANSVQLYKLLYVFPVADKLTLFAGTAAEATDAFPAITPFYGEGNESISRFAGLNPVARVSGGTSGTGLASAAGFIFSISPQLDFRALYGSVNANIPQEAGDIVPGVSNTPLGAGVFGGSNVISTQLTFKPTNSIDVGLNYAHSYHEINILGTGLVRDDIGALAGVELGTPVTLNSVGGTLTWRFSPKVALSGYGAAMFVDASSGGAVNASTTFTSWMVGLHFNDLFKSGNNAGIIFGQPLFRSDASGSAQLAPDGVNRATPYHLEAYYRFKLTDNISITPGAFVLFNPEGDSRNETTTVGVLRSTFTF